jgi:hypothetical protein
MNNEKEQDTIGQRPVDHDKTVDGKATHVHAKVRAGLAEERLRGIQPTLLLDSVEDTIESTSSAESLPAASETLKAPPSPLATTSKAFSVPFASSAGVQ